MPAFGWVARTGTKSAAFSGIDENEGSAVRVGKASRNEVSPDSEVHACKHRDLGTNEGAPAEWTLE